MGEFKVDKRCICNSRFVPLTDILSAEIQDDPRKAPLTGYTGASCQRSNVLSEPIDTLNLGMFSGSNVRISLIARRDLAALSANGRSLRCIAVLKMMRTRQNLRCERAQREKLNSQILDSQCEFAAC